MKVSREEVEGQVHLERVEEGEGEEEEVGEEEGVFEVEED